ncbi:MAG: phosphoribosylanthranilate isomerase [Dehalococcoidia bacterium]|nr:phosphoribosylanthranilate isomerase [Dehalococcoidia bacterium]
MHKVKVKICGIQEEAHVIAAAGGGADFVGFVFAASRRQVTSQRVERLRSALDDLPSRPLAVGVFVDESADVVNDIAERCRLDLVQLSGSEPADYCGKIKRPVIKTVHVAHGETAVSVERRIDELARARTVVPMTFLLDTGGTTARGGTGMRFDWQVAADVSRRHPVLVAGGLDPQNVARLISDVHPYGVDVSSGVECDGRKDSLLIQAFVKAVRRAEQENRDADDSIAR